MKKNWLNGDTEKSHLGCAWADDSFVANCGKGILSNAGFVLAKLEAIVVNGFISQKNKNMNLALVL